MINKQKLYSIAFVSAAMILMLVSIAGAAPFAYITNYDSGNISVIDTVTNTVTATVNLGAANVVAHPWGVAVAPDGTKVYVTELNNVETDNKHPTYCSVAVIDTATNTVTATVPVGSYYIDGIYLTDANPYGVAVSPDGTKLYVVANADYPAHGVYPTVMVINTTDYSYTNVPVGAAPYLLNGITVTPDGTKAYVANTDVGNTGADHQVAVIDTATNT